eukprot:6214144-Pleurochrysis_carterae.AAC.1
MEAPFQRQARWQSQPCDTHRQHFSCFWWQWSPSRWSFVSTPANETHLNAGLRKYSSTQVAVHPSLRITAALSMVVAAAAASPLTQAVATMHARRLMLAQAPGLMRSATPDSNSRNVFHGRSNPFLCSLLGSHTGQ